MVNVIFWLAFGALTGWIASLFSGLENTTDILTDIFIGILGAFVGGVIARIFSGDTVIGLNTSTLVGAVAGSIVLLWARRVMHGITGHSS